MQEVEGHTRGISFMSRLSLAGHFGRLQEAGREGRHYPGRRRYHGPPHRNWPGTPWDLNRSLGAAQQAGEQGFHCSLNHLILPPTFFPVHLHIPVWIPVISPVNKPLLWYLSKSMSFVICLCYGVADASRGHLPQKRHHLTGKIRSSGGHQVAKDVFLWHSEQIMLYSSVEMFPDTLACLTLLLWSEGFLIMPGFCGINIPAFTVVLTMYWRTK